VRGSLVEIIETRDTIMDIKNARHGNWNIPLITKICQ